MRILTDFHHAGLLNSLILLFENRLGGEVYRPIGLEWAEEGFWAVYDHPATREQFLTLNQAYKPKDWSKPLNKIIKEPEPGIYYCQDIDSGYFNKAITLPKFKEMDFDIVIASMPQHIEPFKRLIDKYMPKAKLIYQVGNQWDNIYADNIMASARLERLPENINHVEYHQEFDLDIFNPVHTLQRKTIKSFMNCPDQFKDDYGLLLKIEKSLPDWDIKIHGGMGRDGPLHGSKAVAEGIKHSQFVWHVKPGGDGYGHILFNSAACGVPVIVKKSYYQGKLGEKLLVDGVTCIDIDGLNVQDCINKIREHSRLENYDRMAKAVHANFVKKVDFNQDELKIRAFLERLK